MASELATNTSLSNSIYFLPALGYTIGKITSLSPPLSQSITSRRENPGGRPANSPWYTCINDLKTSYERFISPIKIPTGIASSFPGTNKLKPSLDKRRPNYDNFRSQWLVDHMGLHFIRYPEIGEKGKKDFPYKRFLEGRCCAQFDYDGSNDGRRTFGLAPRNARVGDVAVRVLGSDIPFIFRPMQVDNDVRRVVDRFIEQEMKGELSVGSERPDCYEFVGESFVEQLMFEQGRVLCERGAFGERKAYLLV